MLALRYNHKLLLVAFVLLVSTAHAQTTRYVDGTNCRPTNQLGTVQRPYCQIQIGINAANDGDIVLVKDGTYTGSGNVGLNFNGKPITVRSQNGPATTIIDCELGFANGIQFASGEGPDSVFEGFTVTRAEGEGGISCNTSHPTIRNCVITGNEFGTFGGGIVLDKSDARFENCQITGNQAFANGGGAYINGGRPTFIGCLFSDNTVEFVDGLTAPHVEDFVSGRSGNFATPLAFHPTHNRYYGSMFLSVTGLPTYNAFIYDRFGNYISQHFNFPLEARSWYYNPNTNHIEVITRDAISAPNPGQGLYWVELDAAGNFTNNFIGQLGAMPGLPSSDCAPVYDPVDNVLYARSIDNVVHVVSRVDGSLVRTFTLVDVPPLTAEAIAYNPVTRHILTTEANGTAIYIHDLNGNLIATDELNIPSHDSYGVGFTNNLLTMYAPNLNGWRGFSVRGEEATARFGGGGGICAIDSLLSLVNSTIAGNTAGVIGGGLQLHKSNANLVNVLATGNTASYGGGVASMYCPDVNISNATIGGNTAQISGGGIYALGTTMLKVVNGILWDNVGGEVKADSSNVPGVSYSNILGGWVGGTGNINVQPKFADVDPLRSWTLNDYRLRTDSPCTDSGDNTSVPADSLDVDGDGVVLEYTPWDLDAGPRIVDNEEIVDTGLAGAGAPGVVDMGAFELLPFCVGEELVPPGDIALKVDFDATIANVGGITPMTAAFYHPCVQESAPDVCLRGAIFSAEGGTTVFIKWKYLENPGDQVFQEREVMYRVGRCVRDDLTRSHLGYSVSKTKFFKAYPEANVTVNDLYHTTIQYNSLIKKNMPVSGANDDGAAQADILILDTGQVQVSEDCPDGMVVIRYDRYLGGPLVGLEVLTLNSDGAFDTPGSLPGGAVPIGRKLVSPSSVGVENCRAKMIRNHQRDGIPVAWQRAIDTTDIYPIRPEQDSFAFIVGWYEPTPLQNCWPISVNRYHTDWPTDPQLHVIHQDALQGAVPEGSVVSMRPDIYCNTEIMYQQGFFGGTPPFSTIRSDMFAARKPGYSVIRFDTQPDEISVCGDEVTFEVIESYDRIDPKVLNPVDTSVPWPIGSMLTCVGANCGCVIDCDAYFDDEAATYEFGYLYIPDSQNSAPYAVEIYEDSGQIFPVNSTDVHGQLEGWWYENASYALGTYWPNKLATYDLDWTVDDGRIIIASRRGAETYPESMENYPPGSKIYHAGTIDDVEIRLPGYNPNDEHAILLPFRSGNNIYAVRSDNPWDVMSGHPWVLVQYPDQDRDGLWKMGVHSVIAEFGSDDFYYTAFTAIDSDCKCGDDGTCVGGWSEGVSCTSSKDCICEIDLPVVAGQPIDPLFPVNLAAGVCKDDQGPPQPRTYVEPITGDALWVDRKGGIWAVEEVDEIFSTLQSTANIFIWENWAGDFGCQPWLEYGPEDCCATNSCSDNSFCTGEPWPVTYDPNWPPIEGVCGNDNTCHGGPLNGIACQAKSECGCNYPEDSPCSPLRHIGASFDQSGQCGSIELLHDTVGVRILDPRREVAEPYPSLDVEFLKLPPHLFSGEIGGGGEWPDRIWYDFASRALVFRGIMSDRDKAFLLSLDPNCDSPNNYCSVIEALYTASRVQVTDPNFEAVGGSKFVSLADQGAEEGWVTLAFQNDQNCVDAGLPVSLEVWRVECPPDRGFIRPIQPICPLSEKLVLQFSGDAGGEPEKLWYQWQWSLDFDRNNPLLATWNDYAPPDDGMHDYGDGKGLREVVIEGASIFTLQDSYWRVRYRGYSGCPCTEDVDCNEDDPSDPYDDWAINLGGVNVQISDWTEPQLAEGWVKRVIRGLNPFDQRVEQFHTNDTATYVDMILQAGKRFVDPVPLNCSPDNIDSVGLIELYETVLRRARSFSIDQGISMPGISLAILLATGKISELNMLLGNEAFADAMDPTIGTFAIQGDLASSYDPHAVFSFEEQVASLLDEELILLRGRAETRAPDYNADGVLIATVDNRLPWNFTSGNGQVAYANNYQLLDVEEALRTYPQGHGDAWGYYTTAIRRFYSLLIHPIFDWVVTTEEVLVHGQPVQVGFLYERKFATAAAAKARTGAAIASLTYRDQYTSSPASQQGGFPDPIDADLTCGAFGCNGGLHKGQACSVDSDCVARAWGLADNARRAGQGAYFDWLVANSLLPTEDTINQGIQKIDRTTVHELREISGSYTEIQSILDQADAGLNPIGLASNIVPFGIDPSELADGASHFDQFTQHALVALSNATTAFDYANSNTQRLRNIHDNVDNFEDIVEERELDYTSQLIEIFGRPFLEDIGVGGAYPDGYYGPDIFHFNYMDDSMLLSGSNIIDNQAQSSTTVVMTFKQPDFSLLGDNSGIFEPLGDELKVKFEVSTDGLGVVKPNGWGNRPEPGEIQFARGELLQAIGRYLQSLANYEEQINIVEDQTRLLSALFNINSDILGVMVAGVSTERTLLSMIDDARKRASEFKQLGDLAVIGANAISEAIPKFFVAGLASGGDLTSLARGAIKEAASLLKDHLYGLAQDEFKKEQGYNRDRAIAPMLTQIEVTGLQQGYQQHQQIVALKAQIRSLSVSAVELHTLKEVIHQAGARYHSALGKGLRLLDGRTAFRFRTADQVTKYRYRDMAFRVFRNDALAKYRALFDLAARYVFLAAKAYDYDTNLLGDDPNGGQRFMNKIMRERSLGVIRDNVPYAGNGLAGRLAELMANFNVLRSELGFNSEDRLKRTFSLRWELFRIPNSTNFDADWRTALTNAVIPDLNTWSVYQQYCQPIQPELAIEPAIVIPFDSSVLSGLNLFGWDSNGDETLPPDRYAIKIHSLNLGLSQSYASPPLNNQVHAYLVPTGADMMRVPTDGSIREWNIFQQVLPVPFPTSEAEMQRPEWMAWDTLIGGSATMAHRHRIPTVTGCPITEESCDPSYSLTGRSIWNTQWYLIIPGSQLMGEDPDLGIDVFINGEFGTGVRDIKLTFELYGYSGGTVSSHDTNLQP